ncbi:hypothetical protein LCGC14_1113820 [marine sediment metagenome]|uniref:Uncharacterized protein n=1 Tax=marine sediment metagenome TaxID=412755 RepID=A0A0F9MAR2_9ZZZZ
MAMVKVGHGLRDLKGKRGGNVYTRDRFCLHSNAFPRLVNRNPSSAQKSQRSFFSQCVPAWTALAGTRFPFMWIIHSRAHPVTNKLGEVKILTGRQSFFKINMQRLADLDPITSVPPEYI